MSDPTRFDLDDRQRAMLAEMGVRVWWPQRSDAAPQAQAGDAPAKVTVAPAPAPGMSGVSAPASPALTCPANTKKIAI